MDFLEDWVTGDSEATLRPLDGHEQVRESFPQTVSRASGEAGTILGLTLTIRLIYHPSPQLCTLSLSLSPCYFYLPLGTKAKSEKKTWLYCKS